ncbi:MAG: carboxylating nicotinate-nucleotide diphosphorylase [Candidatus Hydrothermarchaeota archaeon]|nr:carboxylating nicotinate-nucleotide diphosphorylase [Candidatus Hydrothermarchaeota archaeon]
MISRLLEFFKEDVGFADITTESIIPESSTAEAEIVAKESGILAGVGECKLLLKHFNLKCTAFFKDGGEIRRGDAIMKIHGNARNILMLERLLLNILMRMSGIATTANVLVKKCKKYGVVVAGTRKTTPGFREFEKKAIVLGGGVPHRATLSDAILIKDNHIALVDLENAIKKAKARHPRKKIEVEVFSLEDALKACECGADIIMLDNMLPEQIKKVMQELKKKKLRKKVTIELSGGITPENILEYAKLRPDMISVGALTTRSKWLDMSLRIK